MHNNKYIIRNISLLIVFILLIVLTISCSICKNPAESTEENKYFAIYFLNDPNIKYYDIAESDLAELTLESIPWISEEDMEYYDWSTHLIYLKKDKSHFLKWWDNPLKTFPEEWADKPYIVVAGGKRCYAGFFHHAVFSHFFDAPFIPNLDNHFYPSDVLYIDWAHTSPPNDEDVKDALLNAGLYRGGISVTFDTTDAILNIDNADTSTITYKFTITNNDINNLYVLDPDKMGTKLFHHFTNGPVFDNLNGYLFQSTWKTTTPPPSLDYWSPDWFAKLKPGQSIQRTISLKGYPFFPTGEYRFRFSYNGKIFGMEKVIRELPDGNIWVGTTRSNTLIMEWDADSDSLNVFNIN